MLNFLWKKVLNSFEKQIYDWNCFFLRTKVQLNFYIGCTCHYLNFQIMDKTAKIKGKQLSIVFNWFRGNRSVEFKLSKIKILATGLEDENSFIRDWKKEYIPLTVGNISIKKCTHFHNILKVSEKTKNLRAKTQK